MFQNCPERGLAAILVGAPMVRLWPVAVEHLKVAFARGERGPGSPANLTVPIAVIVRLQPDASGNFSVGLKRLAAAGLTGGLHTVSRPERRLLAEMALAWDGACRQALGH